jgi:hypothetical protein
MDAWSRSFVSVTVDSRSRKYWSSRARRGSQQGSGDKACADILLRSERVARAARRGLGADPNFAPLRPDHLDPIAAAWANLHW